MAIIAIISDFGLKDWYVGAMKGVIAGISPDTLTVDITHSISPGNIGSAALALKNSYAFFPKKTVFLVVVDPGVGGKRAPLAVKSENYYFIAPDNGVLTYALQEEQHSQVRIIENRHLMKQVISNTFHGRDIFAPVAAHVARGTPFSRVGPLQPEIVKLGWPVPEVNAAQVQGEVVHIDRFGNLITNISMVEMLSLDSAELTVSIRKKKNIPVRKCYDEAKPGKSLAVLGSCHLLEIGINMGNAAKTLGADIGARVFLKSK